MTPCELRQLCPSLSCSPQLCDFFMYITVLSHGLGDLSGVPGDFPLLILGLLPLLCRSAGLCLFNWGVCLATFDSFYVFIFYGRLEVLQIVRWQWGGTQTICFLPLSDHCPVLAWSSVICFALLLVLKVGEVNPDSDGLSCLHTCKQHSVWLTGFISSHLCSYFIVSIGRLLHMKKDCNHKGRWVFLIFGCHNVYLYSRIPILEWPLHFWKERLCIRTNFTWLKNTGGVWWNMPIIQALRRIWQEDCKFKVSQGIHRKN